MLQYGSLVVYLALACSTAVAFQQPFLRSRSHTMRVRMAAASEVAVIGCAGSVSESIAYRIASTGKQASLLLNAAPSSPEINNMDSGSLQVYVGDLESNSFNARTGPRGVSLSDAVRGKAVIIASDEGPDVEITKETKPTSMFEKVAKVLTTNDVRSVTCVTSVRDFGNQGILGGIFKSGGIESVQNLCKEKNIPFNSVQYGSLIGGLPGLEPLPFMGLPLQEPELDPSYTLRSVVLTDPEANKYAASEVCSRDTLAEVTAQCIERDVATTSNAMNSLVVSTAGSKPTTQQWDRLFSRLVAGSNTELIRIDFAEVSKPQQLVNWLVDVWFPQALIDADAATILTGARPVRALKGSLTEAGGSVTIVWEDIQPDLSVKSLKGLEIKLELGPTPGFSVLRLQPKALPGETALVDRLLEGVSKNVYKKQFCTQLEGERPKVSN